MERNVRITWPFPDRRPAAGGCTLGGGSGRNLAERKEWAVSEDRQICKSVRRHGFKWRLVAADVPGRSVAGPHPAHARARD